MLDRLPEYIEPLQLADKRGALRGHIPLSGMDRLADVLCNDAGYVEVSLFFGRQGRLATIDGQIKSVLALECQNCLNPVEWVVDSEIRLGIVASINEADRLPKNYEPLLVNGEGKVLLKDIIEDELLLVLPDFPKHQHDCFTQNSYVSPKASLSDQQSVNANPFSILAKLKNIGDL